MGFREVPIESIEFNPFAKIGKQWMLVTAGDQEKQFYGISFGHSYPIKVLHQ